MRLDEERVERVRESVRTGLATALAATARGLATASKAVASTASQLRPPEPAPPRQPGAAPPPPPRQAPGAPPATPPASQPPRASTPPRESPATASAVPSPAPASAPSSSGADVTALAERNARDLIAGVADLDPTELRALRAIEAEGKARKTVLAAIDRELAR